ncbi:MAG: DUF2306 domain-containing protein [Saprospiraceae bacterium]
MLNKTILLSIFLSALAVLAFSAVMADNIIPYLRFKYAYGFLGTKIDAVLLKPHFQVAFYVHITSSWIVMLAGLGQFFPVFVRRWPRIHRWTGMVYIWLILVLAAPSGLVLGFYANSGLSSKVGFVLQSIVWWVVTGLAVREILQKNYLRHAEMMLRSYAITLAAMSLRTESYLMYYYLETKPIETYLTVTWLSWVGNLLLIECLIYADLGKRLVAMAFQATKQ